MSNDQKEVVGEVETALLDAVETAYNRLQTTGDHERINAIVVMTDGQENRSRVSVSCHSGESLECIP